MGLTITEKILANASYNSEATSGDVVIADVNIVMAHDSTAPFWRTLLATVKQLQETL